MTSFRTLPLAEFLAATASKSPTPGGGAVAGVTVALGAALGQMVLEYTLGRKRFAEHTEAHEAARAALATGRESALALADADAVEYARLNEAMRGDPNDPERPARLDAAARAALEPPLALTRLAAALAQVLAGLVGTTNPNLESDLTIARDLLATGARAAAHNVEANLPLLVDRAAAAGLAIETAALRDEACALR